jgi:predicted DsbA family dithiol-disulfide isomerase
MRMALASEQVHASVVGAAEFPDDVRRYRITGVPKTVVNDTVEILGAQPESVFISEALAPFAASGSRETRDEQNVHDE